MKSINCEKLSSATQVWATQTRVIQKAQTAEEREEAMEQILSGLCDIIIGGESKKYKDIPVPVQEHYKHNLGPLYANGGDIFPDVTLKSYIERPRLPCNIHSESTICETRCPTPLSNCVGGNATAHVTKRGLLHSHQDFRLSGRTDGLSPKSTSWYPMNPCLVALAEINDNLQMADDNKFIAHDNFDNESTSSCLSSSLAQAVSSMVDRLLED